MASAFVMNATELPAGLSGLSVERTGPSTLRATMAVGGVAKPASRTDIVFIIDASVTNRASLDSGRTADTVWRILEYVNQFDDDGVDFFLASTLDLGTPGAAKVLAALHAGRTPTDQELAEAHGTVSVGQAATRAELDALLAVDPAQIGLAGVLAPAIRAARGRRKPNGRLFIEIVTDGHVVDGEAVVRELAEMSMDCDKSNDKARYRVHVLGIGDINTERLAHWDSGLGEVAPIDIVASDAADGLQEGAQQVFKEMRRSFMSVCATSLLEIHASNLTAASAFGGPMGADELERGKFVESCEQMPPEVVLDLTYHGAPTPTHLSLLMIRDDGTEQSVSVVLPVPEV